MRLLLRQLVIAAATAGEVASTPDRILMIDLDAAGVVDAFTVTASARLFSSSSGHTRMLSQKEGTEFSGCEAALRGQGDSGSGVHLGEDRQAVAGAALSVNFKDRLGCCKLDRSTMGGHHPSPTAPCPWVQGSV